MRYGYQLVTDCLKTQTRARSRSHKDVEATISHYLNTFTSIAVTKANPFPDGKRADILLSGITTIDDPRPGTGTSTSCPPTLWGLPTRRGASAELLSAGGARPPQKRPRQRSAGQGPHARQVQRATCVATTTSQPFALETRGGPGNLRSS